MHENSTVRFSPDLSANAGGNEWGHAGSGLEGFISMLNNFEGNRIEQYAETDRFLSQREIQIIRSNSNKIML